MSDGYHWPGIAQLTFEAWRDEMERLTHEPPPARYRTWEGLPAHEKAAWIAAARMAADVVIRAALI